MDLSEEQIDAHKEQTQKQWNGTPCGQVGDVDWSLEYFKEVEYNRYNSYAPWMREFYQFDNHEGVKLLGIGFGQGTDLIQYCKGGAECYGVDLTENHYLLAVENFRLQGLSAKLFHEDASNLHFEDNMFDKVVSFGALHHTPDIDVCVNEVHRVLKPGGIFNISLYHRNSFFYWISILFKKGLLQGKLFSLGFAGLKSTIESGADGRSIKPYVRLYTKRSMRKLLSQFKTCQIDIRHMERDDIWVLAWILPKTIREKLSKYFGWYIFATCSK